jgi:hypothetical protein
MDLETLQELPTYKILTENRQIDALEFVKLVTIFLKLEEKINGNYCTYSKNWNDFTRISFAQNSQSSTGGNLIRTWSASATTTLRKRWGF